MEEFVLKLSSSTPNNPLFILSVSRDSWGNITGYTATSVKPNAIYGQELPIIDLGNELADFVGTHPIKRYP